VKWFKHISQSKSDPDIIEAEMKFGGDGPHVFWRALEILGCENSASIKMNKAVFYAYFYRPYRKKVCQILTFFSEKSRKNPWDFNETVNIVELSVKRFGDLSMSYTKKLKENIKPVSPIEGEGDQKKKKKKNIKNQLFIPVELTNPRFLTVWKEWENHRKEKKQPLTPTSITKQLNKLKNMGLSRAIAALENSTENGYQGIFEPSNKQGTRAPERPAPTVKPFKAPMDNPSPAEIEARIKGAQGLNAVLKPENAGSPIPQK